MKTHTFGTTLSNKTKVENRIEVPTGAEVFDPDAWRASGIFHPEDSDKVIAEKIADGTVRSAVIDLQRHLRPNANGQREANTVVAAWRWTKSYKIVEVTEEAYATFSEDQLELLQAGGTIIKVVEN